MTKPKKKDNVAKGQQTLAGFVTAMKDKENMGLSSNLRKSSIQRSKAHAYAGNKKSFGNGPRQIATGQQMMLAVDASYRYVVERHHGLFVVKCINHSQSAKTIAYGICNWEDKEALVWIFRAIKDEIEDIVNNLVDKGIRYM